MPLLQCTPIFVKLIGWGRLTGILTVKFVLPSQQF